MNMNTTKGNGAHNGGAAPEKKPLTVEQVQQLQRERGEGRHRRAVIGGELRALESPLETARREALHYIPGAGERVADLQRQLNGLHAEAARLDARELQIMQEIAATVGPAAWRDNAARECGLSPEIAAQLEGNTAAEIHASAKKAAQSIAAAMATEPGATRYPFQTGQEVAW